MEIEGKVLGNEFRKRLGKGNREKSWGREIEEGEGNSGKSWGREIERKVGEGSLR